MLEIHLLIKKAKKKMQLFKDNVALSQALHMKNISNRREKEIRIISEISKLR